MATLRFIRASRVFVSAFIISGIAGNTPLLASNPCGCRIHGDVAPAGGNCIVNLDDILCVLAGFANRSACWDGDLVPCGGNGNINLDDLLSELAAFAGSYACPTTPPAPSPGPARAWESDIDVATFSSVNTRHGNVFTQIPIVSWGGRGPDLSFMLYHNSANVDSPLDLTRGMGFDLGDGWTKSYSDQLILSPPGSPTSITVIDDDGMRDVFALVSGQWQAPPGVFDVLTQDGDGWRVTHKDQSYELFDSAGLLVKVVDATANELIIQRVAGRISQVVDASGRQIVFNYTGVTLTSLTDPEEPDDPANQPARNWFFAYDGNGRLQSFTDAMGFTIHFGYDSRGRITSIEDKDGDTFSYAYAGKLLSVVTDPPALVSSCCSAGAQSGCDDPICEASVCGLEPFCCSVEWDSTCQTLASTECSDLCGQMPAPPLTQQLAFSCSSGSGSQMIYTDRRGSPWTYNYNVDGELTGMTNPLGFGPTLGYDADHNMTLYRDALNHDWTATYDDRGNLLTLNDPLMQTRAWQYDALNNLRFVTDAANNTVELRYEHPLYPTLMTSVIEPPDGQGNPEAVTLVSYYGPADPTGVPGITPGAWNGLLREVYDPNNIWSGFSFDKWGQLATYDEGLVNTSGTTTGCHFGNISSSSGNPVFSSSPGNAGSTDFDANGNAIASSCILIASLPDPPAPPGFPAMCDNLETPLHSANWTAGYSRMGIQKYLDVILNLFQQSTSREFETRLDRFGLPTSQKITTTEPGESITRQFTYARDFAVGTATRIGPDGVETFIQYDAAGRVQLFRRGHAWSPVMTATYTYYADDAVMSVSYGNGTSIHYAYDDARRLTQIEHRNQLDMPLLRMEYDYDERDLPIGIMESDFGGPLAQVTFTYDTRSRLIREARVGLTPYDLEYTYDLGGNRRMKIDHLNMRRTIYHYDIDEPGNYASNNNRLEYYDEFDFSSMMDVPFSTTWYYYNVAGNVKRIVTERADQPNQYSGIRLGYAQNRHTVSYAIGETWTGDSCPMQNHNVHFIREFRYDSGRARYLDRELDPIAYGTNGSFLPLVEKWTDYDGGDVYGDFAITSGNPAQINYLRSFGPGMAAVNPWASSGSGNTSYFHADLIGTTRVMTDSIAATMSAVTYTAFGERISNEPVDGTNRYGYAGAWGYQGHEEFSYLHVGARYYDPSTGRFLQRDPIGIAAGLNVYTYVGQNPSIRVDPSGLATLGVGVSAGVHVGPVNAQVEVSVHIGFSWRKGFSIGITWSFSFGLGIGLGASAGIVGTLTDASCVGDLLGMGYEVGLDAPVGSMSGIMSTTSGPGGYGGGQLGVGPGVGGGIRGGMTGTGGVWH